MKHRNALVCLILVLTLAIGLCPMTGASAQLSLTAVEDSTSSYKPTEIVNGGFEVDHFGNGSRRLGIDEGWTTTDSWTERSSSTGTYGVLAPTTGTYFAEMNANTAAILYQDLTTHGGDIILWTLDHAARCVGDNPQAMEVQVGAPDGNDPSGTGVANLNSHIDASTEALYRSTGVTNPEGKTYGSGNAAELANLSVPQLGSNNPWYKAKGVYVVPAGQSVTRFAFVSLCSNGGLGNMLDNITFSTLLGNTTVTDNGENGVIIKGYWGDTDPTNKLIVKIGSTEVPVDMTNVCGKNFSITVPASVVGSAAGITAYHEDYPTATKPLALHDHTLVYSASGATLSAYCTNTAKADKCTIQGEANKVSITVSATGKEYDGTPVVATLSDTTAWENASLDVPTIEYYKESSTSANNLMNLFFSTAFAEEKLSAAPSAVGNYSARISAGGKTAKVTFSITKSTPTAGPSNLIGVAPTASKAQDGYISGVDSTMEYSTDGGKTWTSVPNGTTTLTGLGKGVYQVRYKATDNQNASPAVKVYVGTTPTTGDNTNITLYAAILVLSAACAVILLQRKRSR